MISCASGAAGGMQSGVQKDTVALLRHIPLSHLDDEIISCTYGAARGDEILRRLDSRRELGLMRPCFRELLADLRGLIGEG